MHQKSAIHICIQIHRCIPVIYLQKGKETLSDAMANGVHYWFSNLPCVRENGWWMSSSSSSLLYKILMYGTLRRRSIFLLFFCSRELLHACIPFMRNVLYIVFVDDDAFDVCVCVWRTKAHLRKFITSDISEWIKIILCIEIASPNYYDGKRKKEFHVEIPLCHATNNL